MTHYIYPQNLKATANMWLWSLRDFAIMGVAALISIVILVELHLMMCALQMLEAKFGDVLEKYPPFSKEWEEEKRTAISILASIK